jgi:hypothetical protein
MKKKKNHPSQHNRSEYSMIDDNDGDVFVGD